MHWFLKFLTSLGGLVLIFIVILSLPKVLPTKKIANTQVFGLIFQNQIWEGTVRISGDIWAFPGTVVSVKPGTRILISLKGDKFNMDYLPWHLKSGINTTKSTHGVYKGEPFWDEKQKIQIHFSKLVALGNKEMPIVIKSDGNFGSPYDVNSIYIDSGIVSNAYISNYRRLEIGRMVTVRDSEFFDVGECGVCVNSGSPSIINNTFKSSFHEAIWIQKSSPKITDNLFVNLSGDGIKFDSRRRGAPVISYNTFEMPEKTVIRIISGGENNGGVISFNKFSGNSKINIACDSKIKISENILLSLIVFGGSGCGGSYTFGPNYWGTDNIKTVFSEKITNKDRKFEVIIASILNSPPEATGRR